MKPFEVKPRKTIVAAAFASTAMAVAFFSVPALSENSDTLPPMTFDSIGSMLQDMDREQAQLQADAERYAVVPATAHNSGHACQSEEINGRLTDLYEGLRDQVAQFDLEKINALEAEIFARHAHRVEVTRAERAALILEARASALAAIADSQSAFEVDRESVDDLETLVEAAEAALTSLP